MKAKLSPQLIRNIFGSWSFPLISPLVCFSNLQSRIIITAFICSRTIGHAAAGD